MNKKDNNVKRDGTLELLNNLRKYAMSQLLEANNTKAEDELCKDILEALALIEGITGLKLDPMHELAEECIDNAIKDGVCSEEEGAVIKTRLRFPNWCTRMQDKSTN